MELVRNFEIDREERNRIIDKWTHLAAKLFAGGCDELHPSDLQGMEPTTSTLIQSLADLALRPLVEAGACQRHEKHPYCWFTLRSRDKATAFLNQLSNT